MDFEKKDIIRIEEVRINLDENEQVDEEIVSVEEGGDEIGELEIGDDVDNTEENINEEESEDDNEI